MPIFKMKNGLGEIKLKYIVEDMDRHGNVRIYLRRKGQRKTRIKSAPGTQEFLDEYHDILSNKPTLNKAEKSECRTTVSKSSLRWLCIQYFSSAGYKQLASSTKTVRRQILDRICVKDGAKPFALLEPRHIRMRRDAKAEKPESANGELKALRQLFSFAVEYDLAKSNPAKDVPYLKSNSEGFHSWTPEEVEQFVKHHPIGTKARLAFSLLLLTGQRRSDIVRLGTEHMKDGWLCFTQQKNKLRKPIKLSIPILPELQAVLSGTPTGSQSFLVTEFGKPFTSNGFGNWFRKRCDEAGLSQCSAHGLRKAGATIAAENGATDQQLMAMFGWRTSKQVNHYTRAANQKSLAGSGMRYLVSDS